MKAAIYARFSTNLQSDRSIDDQVTLCKAYAIQNGYDVVKVYSDAAKSGASMHNREGIRNLMADAMMGAFDTVIVEALDRLSRDMEDLAGISKRLKFAGIDLVGVHDGVANTVTVGLRGLVGQLFREDNALKVRRGLAGRVKQGLSGGGQAYGYKPDPLNKGKLLIVEDEARIIRRVFEQYAAGVSPRHIAYALNKEGITPPRGKMWNASTINGSLQRGNGILHNSLYIGLRIWNRVTMIKDPDTGRRVSRPNPESEWEKVEVPELRIVSDELWEIAQKQRRGPRTAPGLQQRPKRLLSGMLKCGCCGAGMSAAGKDRSGRVRVRCSAAKESGSCPEPKSFYLDTIEKAVVTGVVHQLRSPDRLALFIKTYQQEQMRVANTREANRSKLEGDLAKVKQQINAIVEQIANEVIEPEDAKEQISVLRARKHSLEEDLAQAPEPVNVVSIHPVAAQRYEEMISQINLELQNTGSVNPGSVGASLLRELIETVDVYRGPDAGRVEVQVKGHLNVLLSEGTTAYSRSVVNGPRNPGRGLGGSGGGTRTPDTRIMIPLL